MVHKELTVGRENFTAVEARELADLCNACPCEVTLQKAKMNCNGKSIMGVISAGIKKGETLTVITEGECEEETLASLCSYLEGASEASPLSQEGEDPTP